MTMTVKSATAGVCLLALAGTMAVSTAGTAADDYAPTINPADFSTKIDHPLFNMPVGKTMIYEAKAEDGLERAEIVITPETRTIMGVQTVVFWDRVYVDGKIKEETRDYLAQHKDGSVWYFGEAVDNYENGKLKDHAGAWIAGVDGAQPGVWMPAKLTIGDVYREEYYKGHAEDMARIVSTTETVETPLGVFNGCLKTENWTPLEPDVKEAKFYCREIGGTAADIDLVANERSVIVKVENGG